MNTRIRTRFATTLLTGVAAVLSMTAAMAADPIKIGFIVKFPGGFFDTLKNGGKTFASSHPDVQLLFGEATSGTDAVGEISIIELMVTQGVKGIAVTPIDPSVIPALDAAVAAGVKVVLMDNDLPTWKNKTSVVATDNFAGGKLAGQWLATKLAKGSTIGMIAGVPGVPALDARLKGMQEGLGDGYKTVGGNVATGCGSEKAVGAAENILTANPDVAAFYGACSGPAMGAISALSNAGVKPGKVLVVGFDGDPQEFAAIKAGTEAATVVQYPAKIGEYGVQTLYKALKGETVPAFVDTGTGLATIENLAKFQ